MRTRWTTSMLIVAATLLVPACPGNVGRWRLGNDQHQADRRGDSEGDVSRVLERGPRRARSRQARSWASTILWQGPAREDDREEQIKVVDTIRSRGVSGIVLAPLDNKALRTPVTNAVRAGIPVVIIDSQLDSQDYRSIVETDNFEGGKAAGTAMVKLLDGKGPVLMLAHARRVGQHHAARAGLPRRTRGRSWHQGRQFESVRRRHGGRVRSRRARICLMALRAAQGGVAGVFCPNESTTFGMLRALQNANLAGKIRFVGFDGNERLLQAMRDRQIDALVVQDPFGMGYTSVKTLITAIKGRPGREEDQHRRHGGHTREHGSARVAASPLSGQVARTTCRSSSAMTPRLSVRNLVKSFGPDQGVGRRHARRASRRGTRPRRRERRGQEHARQDPVRCHSKATAARSNSTANPISRPLRSTACIAASRWCTRNSR